MLITTERIVLVVVGLVGVALCMPAASDVYVVDYQNDRSDDGSYSFK